MYRDGVHALADVDIRKVSDRAGNCAGTKLQRPPLLCAKVESQLPNLKFKPHAELNPAWPISFRGGLNQAKLGIPRSKLGIRWRKPRRIEGIENFRPQLQGHAFTRLELFVEIGIEVVNAISSQV